MTIALLAQFNTLMAQDDMGGDEGVWNEEPAVEATPYQEEVHTEEMPAYEDSEPSDY